MYSHSTRKQKAEATKSREMDVLSDYGNMEIMLGDGKVNFIERDLYKVMNGPERHLDLEILPRRGGPSQENETRTLTIEMTQFGKTDLQSPLRYHQVK